MTDYDKLKKYVEETDQLIINGATYSKPEFKAWQNKVRRWLVKRFGEYNREVLNFDAITYCSRIPGQEENTRHCAEGLEQAKAILITYFEDLEDNDQSSKTQNNALDFSKVFIVHGHDGELKQSVARLIEKQNIEAIILSEQTNQGKTIIEKLEQNSNVGCAVCLFTGDDTGKGTNDEVYHSRARQNVVFEAGLFMGKLGRDHVVFLADSGIELPSDLNGIVYSSITSWQIELLKELKKMGYPIDLNKLFEES